MINFISSDSRGGADHGWLKTRFSFSFAEYYDPDRMGFGALRVINDDQIGGESGFGTHSHQNMEIITIMIEGTLTHKDSMGTEADITAGEVQVMSAGTGVLHSEYNRGTETVKLFQIWIEPKSYGIVPRYEQKAFDFTLENNSLVTVVSPDGRDGSLVIHQNALIFRGVYQEVKQEKYTITPGNGVYLIMRAGRVQIGDKTLSPGDALSVSDELYVTLDIAAGSDFVLLEIPPFRNVL